LLRTYCRWDRIADKQLADAYLRRVMINTRTEWWRGQKLQELPSAHLPDTSVEDSAEQHAVHTLLMDIIKTLAPQQRAVVMLRHWEQMSTQETAATLGMAPGTVKSTLHRALAQLRQELLHRDPDSASPAAGTANPPTKSPTGTITATSSLLRMDTVAETDHLVVQPVLTLQPRGLG
jgi:RNA polymerase sigma-70 factor (sigma-E family)